MNYNLNTHSAEVYFPIVCIFILVFCVCLAFYWKRDGEVEDYDRYDVL